MYALVDVVCALATLFVVVAVTLSIAQSCRRSRASSDPLARPLAAPPAMPIASADNMQTSPPEPDSAPECTARLLRRLEFARWCVQHGILSEFSLDGSSVRIEQQAPSSDIPQRRQKP
jgi:hypothetical protein